ncbi:energy transducer TonB [Marinoscillum sp. 108]|uniref:energy transducer TonB n=1 Tax=Marinoscillum sp. 108 TaxID=2653151 RepID=UPI0012F22690
MKHILLLFAFVAFVATAVQSQIPVELFELLDDKDTTNLYFGADKNPEFPGGYEKLVRFYQNNLYYPTSARIDGSEGTVYVMFIVELNGKLTNIKATNSISKDIDKSAERLIKRMPKWIPGEQDGNPVRVLHVQPVTYKLE